MNRRSLLKGLAAALILPPTLLENTDEVKRYWSLDRTMVGQGERATMVVIDEAAYNASIHPPHRSFAQWVEAWPDIFVQHGQYFSVGDHVPLFDDDGTIREYGIVTRIFPSQMVNTHA